MRTAKNDIDSIFEGFVTKWEEVDGVRMHYLEGGSGDTLVLVHGWSNNGRGWWPLVAELKDTYHLVLMDMPGFGDSDSLDRYTIELQAEYVAGFLRGLKTKPLSVVGLSMGSQVLAAFGSMYPTLTSSMILFGSVFHKGRRKRLTQRVLKLFLQAIGRGKRRSKVLKRVVTDDRFALLTCKYINMYRMNAELALSTQDARRKMRIESFIQMGVSEATFRIEQALDGIAVPTLLAFGDHDKITSVGEAEQMMAGKEGSYQFAMVPESGHVAPMEQPKESVELMESFLNTIRDDG